MELDADSRVSNLSRELIRRRCAEQLQEPRVRLGSQERAYFLSSVEPEILLLHRDILFDPGRLDVWVLIQFLRLVDIVLHE